MDTRVDQLIKELYDKHRIVIKQDDPAIAMALIIIEQNEKYENEKWRLVDKQISELIAGTENVLSQYRTDLKKDAEDFYLEQIKPLTKEIRKRMEPQDREKTNSPFNLFNTAIFALSLINTALIIILLWIL